MRVMSYVDRRGSGIRLLEYGALSLTAKAFRQRGKEKTGRRDKGLANGPVMYRLS